MKHYEEIPEVICYCKLITNHVKFLDNHMIELSQNKCSEEILELISKKYSIIKRNYLSCCDLTDHPTALYPFLYFPFLKEVKKFIDCFKMDADSINSQLIKLVHSLRLNIRELYFDLIKQFDN
ncbi:hypothetical protein [Liquorilactobacillus mali]|uniref:hypothetical protein n=1 Tax=Liquorilactobacillus mali TaxID=1618 RepID=UPI0007051179|nr:hypothetical protein [Liquorilactobacillus mali]